MVTYRYTGQWLGLPVDISINDNGSQYDIALPASGTFTVTIDDVEYEVDTADIIGQPPHFLADPSSIDTNGGDLEEDDTLEVVHAPYLFDPAGGLPLDFVSWRRGETQVDSGDTHEVVAKDLSLGLSVRHSVLNGYGVSFRDGQVTPAADYEIETLSILNAFDMVPDETRRDLINDFVVALKTAEIWSKLDTIYLFAAADEQSALINWKTPGASDATLVNSPSFTADRGFLGNGSNAYINTNFNAFSASGSFEQNSCYAAARALAGATTALIGYDNAGAHPVALHPNFGGSTRGRVHCTDEFTPIGGADSNGYFWSMGRNSSTTGYLRRGSSTLTTTVGTSAARRDAPFAIMRVGATYNGATRAASAFFGGYLTEAESDVLQAAEAAYMTAVGAI